MPTILHLTASTFFGGPERQMLGLAESLPAGYRTIFLSFREAGRCVPFLERARAAGFVTGALEHDTPHLPAAARELCERLRDTGADLLCCHGYKADLLGRWAARRAGVPIVAVSRGWTYENLKIRLYEALDRFHLRWMDRVVCVSGGQAAKVCRAGVSADRIVVIRNAIRPERFEHPDLSAREELQGLFPDPVGRIIGVAGRLSPEKGFDILVEAAARVVRSHRSVGFVLCGDGPLRDGLAQRIADLGLGDRFILAGFRTDLDRLIPHFDLMVQSSYTEGLPNVILEACAAGVAVVATAVGGTPEVVEDGRSGWLVPPGDPEALSRALLDALGDATRCRAMAASGRERVRGRFGFEAQAAAYRSLFDELARRRGRRDTPPGAALECSGSLADPRG